MKYIVTYETMDDDVAIISQHVTHISVDVAPEETLRTLVSIQAEVRLITADGFVTSFVPELEPDEEDFLFTPDWF